MALETEAAIPVDDVPDGAAKTGYVEQTAGVAASVSAAAAVDVVGVVASAAALAAVLVFAVLVVRMLVAVAVASLPGDDRPHCAHVSGGAVAVG